MATLGDIINKGMEAVKVDISGNDQIMAFLSSEDAKREVTPENAWSEFSKFFIPASSALDNEDLNNRFRDKLQGSLHGKLAQFSERGYVQWAKENGLPHEELAPIFKDNPDMVTRSKAIGNWVNTKLEAKYKDQLNGKGDDAKVWEDKIKEITDNLNAKISEQTGQAEHWKGQFDGLETSSARRYMGLQISQSIMGTVKFNPNMPKDAIALKIASVAESLQGKWNVTHSDGAFSLIDTNTNEVAYGPNGQKLEFNKVLTSYFEPEWLDTGKPPKSTNGDGKGFNVSTQNADIPPHSRQARFEEYAKGGPE